MATGEYFVGPLRETVAALLPPSLADVSDIVVREWSDGIWVRGAAAMTLRDLYGAPWGTTGPAPTRATPRSRRTACEKRVGVGVIGCGNISSAYLTAAKKFPDPRHCRARRRAARRPPKRAPRNLDCARGRSRKLLADPEVEIILNLTVPIAHVEVGLQAIAAGKHVYSEKPLGVDGRRGAQTRRGG